MFLVLLDLFTVMLTLNPGEYNVIINYGNHNQNDRIIPSCNAQYPSYDKLKLYFENQRQTNKKKQKQKKIIHKSS